MSNKFFLFPISLYHSINRLKHYLIYFLFPQHYIYPVNSLCRFSPTCSHYLYQAITTHGILIGVFLGIKRLVRCQPWSKGGFDPVPGKHNN